jgi:hypothetical protein
MLDTRIQFLDFRVYYVKPTIGNPFWLKEIDIVYYEKYDNLFNYETSQNLEASLFQFRDEDKPNWYFYLTRKYGN